MASTLPLTLSDDSTKRNMAAIIKVMLQIKTNFEKKRIDSDLEI
jgi:hypothetical protein